MLIKCSSMVIEDPMMCNISGTRSYKNSDKNVKYLALLRSKGFQEKTLTSTPNVK